MHKLLITTVLLAMAALPSLPQSDVDVKATILKHLKRSEDFTVKVAEAMPEADYGFKLTPAQMSFGEQLVHLSGALSFILGTISGQKPSPPAQKATAKASVIQFVHSSYEQAIDEVAKLTPEQLSKSYIFEGQTMSGLDLLLAALDHSTQHRASAEMYLRVKGITPPQYQF